MKVKIELELELPEGILKSGVSESEVKKAVIDIVRAADDTFLKAVKIDVQEPNEWQVWRLNKHDFLLEEWIVCDLPGGIGHAPCSAARHSDHYQSHFKDMMTGTRNEALKVMTNLQDLRIANSMYAEQPILRRERYRFYDPIVMAVDIPGKPAVHVDLTEFFLTEVDAFIAQLAEKDFQVDRSDLHAVFDWMKRTNQPVFDAFLASEGTKVPEVVLDGALLKSWIMQNRSGSMCAMMAASSPAV